MTVVDLGTVRERRAEERQGALFESVRVKALGEAERAFAVARSLIGVDRDMAVDVCRGARRRLLVWVRDSLQGEAADMRACAHDLAATLYKSRLLDLTDGRFGCDAHRRT